MSKKSNIARLSIISNTVLILMKFVVGFMTGSVSIISEAIHSVMDLIAAIVAYVSVRIADQPPDRSHPYGHEKIENISGVIETVLIFIAAILIIKEAVLKLIHHSHVQSVGLGFAVMMISAIVNWVVSSKLYKVAREEGSVAIEADALHLKVDVYTSLGVAAGLLILWITDLHFLDPLVAILIALAILREAWHMLSNAFGPLMDAHLSDAEEDIIKKILSKYQDVLIDYHDLRTRRSGNIKHMDLHVTAPRNMTVKEFHDICDRIEKDMESGLQHTKVLIHGEPCETQCHDCSFDNRDKYCQ